MKCFTIKVADLTIKINCLYDLAFDLCKDYLSCDTNIDFEVNIKESDLDKYEANSNEYKDFMAILGAISNKLADYNKALVHGASIEYNGLGYIFIADSGVGKSTHIKLWKQYVDNVDIINGDKPIVDTDGYVYGTPWCGKERWNRNTKVKIGGIIILSRDSYNHMEVVDPKDYIKEILESLDRNNINSINIIDSIIKNTKLYRLGCDISFDAVKVCKGVIDNENK